MQYNETQWPRLGPNHVWVGENRGVQNRHATRSAAAASREAGLRTPLNRDTGGLRKSPREGGPRGWSCLQRLLQREGQTRFRGDLDALALSKHLGSRADGSART